MAIDRKSELRTVEILFNAGALVSIQATYFERLEEDGIVVPGTFNNRVAPFDPESAEGRNVVAMLGDGAFAGIMAKDEALQSAYKERDSLREQLEQAISELTKLREGIATSIS